MPAEKPLDRFEFQRVPRDPGPTEGARRGVILKFFLIFFLSCRIETYGVFGKMCLAVPWKAVCVAK